MYRKETIMLLKKSVSILNNKKKGKIMNAPSPGNIANIEFFRELLPKGFIEETLERQATIQKNKEESLVSVKNLHNDLNGLNREVNNLGDAFIEQGKVFQKLNSSCKGASKQMDEFAVKARELSENMAKIAATIRQTNGKRK